MDDHTGFTFEIPLIDFTRLAENAASTINLLTALTTPVPSEVAAMGPVAKEVYRGAVARGVPVIDLNKLVQSGQFEKFLERIKDDNYTTTSVEKGELSEFVAIAPALVAAGATIVQAAAVTAETALACVANPLCRAAALLLGNQTIQAGLTPNNYPSGFF